jgi:hypothetical protein
MHCAILLEQMMTGSSSAATGTMKPTGKTDLVSLPAVVD